MVLHVPSLRIRATGDREAEDGRWQDETQRGHRSTEPAGKWEMGVGGWLGSRALPLTFTGSSIPCFAVE